MVQIIFIYLTLINVTGFFMMGADKRRAKKRQWRISERALFLVSLSGGSIGVWIGMYVFRHKTKHRYFVWGIPFIIVMQAALAVFCANL